MFLLMMRSLNKIKKGTQLVIDVIRIFAVVFGTTLEIGLIIILFYFLLMMYII